MNIYNNARKQREEAERCYTNALQCLSDKRDANINFRLPGWMKNQINNSGKSEADFIIGKLGLSMFKPFEQSEESWQNEINQLTLKQ